MSASIISGLPKEILEVHQSVGQNSTLEPDAGVRLHRTDFSSSKSVEALFRNIKPDVIFSTYAGGSLEVQKSLIDCAVRAHVHGFVPAEFGQDSLNEKVQERLPPCQERARVIEYLRSHATAGHISWVAVATGCWLEHGLISGNIGFDLKWHSATIHGTGDERFAASSTAWNGRVAAAVIEHWDEVMNQYLYASGTMTNANDTVRCLEKAMGKKWVTGHVEVEECTREAERRLDRGFPDAGMFLMERSVLYDQTLDAFRPFREKSAVEKLGLKTERLEEIVEKVVHHHEHHDQADCGCD